ncbi:hypothetical protein Sste5346_003636 [Sporothrix stenoceras]|uniref:Uncharacterized protein n=1 Tax=Sporothrix stenoceras TaxID=5173 RepID=A0ABR3ZDU9_9PEZI
MKHTLAIYCVALSGAGISGASAGVVRPPPVTTPAAQASLTLPGQTFSLPRPSNVLIHARQDNDNNNAQIQQLQQQEQQEQQRNAASLSSISSSFSSRFTSLSSSASSTVSQMQSSLQSAQQAMNTLQQSANDASRSASQASQSAASAVASVQSSAASAQASLSSSLQASMVASASSAEQVLSISMSSVMVAAVSSVSASFVAQQAAAVANLPAPPTATVTAVAESGFPGTVPEVNGAVAPQGQSSFLQTNQRSNVLGACSTPEVVLAFAGIILGAVGLSSLGCIVFLWFWKRRPAVKNSSDKKTNSRGSTGGASGTGLSGESRSSGGSLRQWRIRASTTRPKMGGTAASPSNVSLKEYKLPEYERVFFENKETKAKSTTSSPTKSTSSPAFAAPAVPVESTAPTATAVSTNDRIFSTWSFTTAGGGETSTRNNTNNNNGSTFFEASSPTSSARDVVAPLNVYQNQQQQRASRNFSRTSRAFNSSSNSGVNKPRPTSSVYEPFGLGIRSEPRGLDRISRMEEEWNRSQMQRATTTAGNTANKASNAPLYTTNYAYYAGNGGNNNNNNNNGNTRQKEPTASRYANKDSADSLAREYHDFVSQLAPVSQYGATPAATAVVAESSSLAAATSPSSRNRAQRSPTVPPAGPLPGLPSRGNEESEAGTGFSIRPYLQRFI